MSKTIDAGDRRRWFTPPQVEKYGVDTIPEAERTATPWSFFLIMMGANMSMGVALFGWLPITLGLGFWDAFTSLMVGTLVGMAFLAPMILIGSRAATNNSTASGAHFGVRGRLIGSFVGLSIAIVYTAIAVWTGSDAVVGSLNRLLGTPDSQLIRSVSYGVIVIVITLIAIYGFRLLLRAETALLVVGGMFMILGLVALSSRLNIDYAGGAYVLGGRWQTWMLSMVLGAAGPLALVCQTGDWSRYISPARYPTRALLPVGMLATFLGLMVPQTIGLLLAVAFVDPFAPYVDGLIATSPTWYVVFILLLGLMGAGGLASSTAYSCGLDLDAIVPALTRVQATIATSAVAAAVVYVGALASSLADYVVAISLVLLAVSTPWAVITGLGFLFCGGTYDLNDLQVFNRRETGGRYWFLGGFNYRAVTAWVAGSVFGVLTVTTSLYVGPLANIAGGVDLSFIGSAVVGGVIYLLLRAVFPEQSLIAAAAQD